MDQITLGYSGLSTEWQSSDLQVTPAPEPAAYGALFTALSLAVLGSVRAAAHEGRSVGAALSRLSLAGEGVGCPTRPIYALLLPSHAPPGPRAACILSRGRHRQPQLCHIPRPEARALAKGLSPQVHLWCLRASWLSYACGRGSGDVAGHQPEEWSERVGIAASPGAGQLQNGLGHVAQAEASDGASRPRSVARSRQGALNPGGEEASAVGRQTEEKALIMVAAEEDGKGIGRIRLRQVVDLTRATLHGFIAQSIDLGSTVRTDGLNAYLEMKGYVHDRQSQRRQPEGEHLLPRVHRVVSLLKRWLLGTHQGAIGHEYLDYYLDEFTFRFNRSANHGIGKPSSTVWSNKPCKWSRPHSIHCSNHNP